METKEQLIKHIKTWIQLEDEIKRIQKNLKSKRLELKGLTNDLIEVMKENDIECFDINNGKLLHSRRKVKQAISKKLLLKSLTDYLEDSVEVEKITNYILESREIKETDIIRRKINKS